MQHFSCSTCTHDTTLYASFSQHARPTALIYLPAPVHSHPDSNRPYAAALVTDLAGPRGREHNQTPADRYTPALMHCDSSGLTATHKQPNPLPTKQRIPATSSPLPSCRKPQTSDSLMPPNTDEAAPLHCRIHNIYPLTTIYTCLCPGNTCTATARPAAQLRLPRPSPEATARHPAGQKAAVRTSHTLQTELIQNVHHATLTSLLPTPHMTFRALPYALHRHSNFGFPIQ